MSTKPSLGRVAVLLFYSDRHGKSEDMQRQNNRHRRHLLSEGVAPELVLAWAGVLLLAGIPPEKLPASRA